VLPHVATQSIPALLGSEAAVATSVAWAPVCSIEGSAEESVTEIGSVPTIVAVAVADLDLSLVDVALMVIVPPEVTLEDKADNVAAAPLDVWLVIDPQLDAGQLTLQSTPAAVESFNTMATRRAVLPDPEF
jgi:hypothetical protein